MPMNAASLGVEILAAMRANIQGAYPQAIPTPFQVIMANAIAKGIVKSVKGACGTGLSGQFAATAPSIGIIGIDPASMLAEARNVFLSKIGSIGPALPLMMMAVYVPVVKHMAMVTVTTATTSGFGGPLLKIDQMPKEVVFNNIIAEIPETYRNPILETQGGRIMFEAIATGFATDMTTKGKPTPLPLATSGPTGQTVAKFT